MPDKSRIKEALSDTTKTEPSLNTSFQNVSKAMQNLSQSFQQARASINLAWVKVIVKDWSLTGDIKKGYTVHMLVDVVETGEERRARIDRKMFIKESEFNRLMETGEPFHLRKDFLVDE